MTAPVYLLIEQQEDGVLLLYCDRGGPMTDTWHSTVEDAMAQAEFEFGIHSEEWADGDVI